MAIRKFTNPRALDVSPGLQDILRRNGMQAHISLNKFGEPELIVMGHDSPVLNYKLSNRQVDDLSSQDRGLQIRCTCYRKMRKDIHGNQKKHQSDIGIEMLVPHEHIDQ